MFDEWYMTAGVVSVPVCILKRKDTHYMELMGYQNNNTVHLTLSAQPNDKLAGATQMDSTDARIRAYKYYAAALHKALVSNNKLVVTPHKCLGIVISEINGLVQYATIFGPSYYAHADVHYGTWNTSTTPKPFRVPYIVPQNITIGFAVASKPELHTKLRSTDGPIIIGVEAAYVSVTHTLSVTGGTPVGEIISRLKEYLDVV